MIETLYYSMAALISYTMREQHQPMILEVDDRDNIQLQGHNLAGIFEIVKVDPRGISSMPAKLTRNLPTCLVSPTDQGTRLVPKG